MILDRTGSLNWQPPYLVLEDRSKHSRESYCIWYIACQKDLRGPVTYINESLPVNPIVDDIYRVIPAHRNWQIETAVWNLAGFLHCALETRW